LIEGLRLVVVWGAAQGGFAAVLRRQDILATDVPQDVDPLDDVWLCPQLVSKGVGLAYEPERLTYGESMPTRRAGPVMPGPSTRQTSTRLGGTGLTSSRHKPRKRSPGPLPQRIRYVFRK
jgi:hypothetical protein